MTANCCAKCGKPRSRSRSPLNLCRDCWRSWIKAAKAGVGWDDWLNP